MFTPHSMTLALATMSSLLFCCAAGDDPRRLPSD